MALAKALEHPYESFYSEIKNGDSSTGISIVELFEKSGRFSIRISNRSNDIAYIEKAWFYHIEPESAQDGGKESLGEIKPESSTISPGIDAIVDVKNSKEYSFVVSKMHGRENGVETCYIEVVYGIKGERSSNTKDFGCKIIIGES